MNNEFSFDEFLTEKSLMEKYQVSRAPVREALMQLRSDRIIASTPRHGYRIRKPAPGRAAGISSISGLLWNAHFWNVIMIW